MEGLRKGNREAERDKLASYTSEPFHGSSSREKDVGAPWTECEN